MARMQGLLCGDHDEQRCSCSRIGAPRFTPGLLEASTLRNRAAMTLAAAPAAATSGLSRPRAPAAPGQLQHRALTSHMQPAISSSRTQQAPSWRRQVPLPVQAAAATGERLAVSQSFEQYILDLQRRIIEVGGGGRSRGHVAAAAQVLALVRGRRALMLMPPGSRSCPCCPGQAAEELDGSGAKFLHDRWERSATNPNAGYGITSGTGPGCLRGNGPR